MKVLVYFVTGLSVLSVGLVYLTRDGDGPRAAAGVARASLPGAPDDGFGAPIPATGSPQVRVTRAGGHDGDKPGVIDRLFRSVSATHDSHSMPQEPRAPSRATSGGGPLPRDFTARGPQPSKARRITVGD